MILVIDNITIDSEDIVASAEYSQNLIYSAPSLSGKLHNVYATVKTKTILTIEIINITKAQFDDLILLNLSNDIKIVMNLFEYTGSIRVLQSKHSNKFFNDAVTIIMDAYLVEYVPPVTFAPLPYNNTIAFYTGFIDQS